MESTSGNYNTNNFNTLENNFPFHENMNFNNFFEPNFFTAEKILSK